MAQAQVQTKLSEAEYLAIERAAETKSEFFDGEMFAMTGASQRHNLIVANLVRDLSLALRNRTCEVYPSDMRVRIPATGLYVYPDVTVVCGEPTFTDDELDTLTNPTLLVEVLSPTTADYDRGKKFEHYRTIASLREVLLIKQDLVHIVQYKKLDDGSWNLRETRDLNADLRLISIDADLSVEDTYAKVDLDEPAKPGR